MEIETVYVFLVHADAQYCRSNTKNVRQKNIQKRNLLGFIRNTSGSESRILINKKKS